MPHHVLSPPGWPMSKPRCSFLCCISWDSVNHVQSASGRQNHQGLPAGYPGVLLQRCDSLGNNLL